MTTTTESHDAAIATATAELDGILEAARAARAHAKHVHEHRVRTRGVALAFAEAPGVDLAALRRDYVAALHDVQDAELAHFAAKERQGRLEAARPAVERTETLDHLARLLEIRGAQARLVDAAIARLMAEVEVYLVVARAADALARADGIEERATPDPALLLARRVMYCLRVVTENASAAGSTGTPPPVVESDLALTAIARRRVEDHPRAGQPAAAASSA